jgi:hypothetical protein
MAVDEMREILGLVYGMKSSTERVETLRKQEMYE